MDRDYQFGIVTGPWQIRRIYDWNRHGWRVMCVAEVSAPDSQPIEEVGFTAVHFRRLKGRMNEISQLAYEYLCDHGPSSVKRIAAAIEPLLIFPLPLQTLRLRLYAVIKSSPHLFEEAGSIQEQEKQVVFDRAHNREFKRLYNSKVILYAAVAVKHALA